VYPNKLQFDDVTFVASSQLTADEVVGTMKRFGFAIVKGAMPGEEMIYFRQVLDDWYDTTRKRVEEGQIPKDEFQHHFLNGISGPLLHPHLQKFFDAMQNNFSGLRQGLLAERRYRRPNQSYAVSHQK
jgi:hypothetical protein